MLFYIFLRLAIAKKVDKCSIFALTREDGTAIISKDIQTFSM